MRNEYTKTKTRTKETRNLHKTKIPTACPYCSGSGIKKKGTNKMKYGAIQRYYCRHCDKIFTPLVTKHYTTPLAVVIAALSRYNRLHTQTDTARFVTKKYSVPVRPQNVHYWVRAHKMQLPFLRMRDEARLAHKPHTMILEHQFLHGQVYDYKYHRAKTELLFAHHREHREFRPIAAFLEEVPVNCPHALFRDNTSRASKQEKRFNIDGVRITPKQNAAIDAAQFVLQTVSRNRLRHPVLQEFMLVNDSVTVAVEVPIVLTDADITHYREDLSFDVPLTLEKGGAITGHIDILQIRNGMIHILDYKPNAKKEKPIEQLMVYALALARHTGLRLFHFKCAWFDDEHYYEFYPLHVVHKKKTRSL